MIFSNQRSRSNPILIKEIGTFGFHPAQRERFSTGQLRLHWAKQYPQLFDEQDIEIASHQNIYHFFEWLGAILLFETMGYLSLVEKYEFRKHKRKEAILRKLVSTNVLNLIDNSATQCPDLFVCARDMSDWFFCEVKGPGDRLRPVQKEYFEELSKLSGKSICTIRFKTLVRRRGVHKDINKRPDQEVVIYLCPDLRSIVPDGG